MTFPILGGNSAVAGGYTIDNSLRFNAGDSAYLSRTPSSASNRKTWTISAWVKRAGIFDSSGVTADASQVILGSAPSGSNYAHLMFTHDQMQFYDINSGTYVFRFRTNAEFRDPSAWYHVVISCDTTQATESNRFKWYINGEQITNWANEVYPSQNADTLINSTNLHTVGRYADASSGFFNGYMSEYHLIDGTAKAPTDFGEFDEDSGIWKPKEYDGTYGTNGFYLDFENSGSLGADQSGNSNNFTPTNLASTDQTTDTPTNNFCTLNSLANAIPSTLSEGNLKSVPTAYNDKYVFSTFGLTSGKWYFEVKDIDQGYRGVVLLTDSDHNSALAGSNYIGVALFTGGLFTSSGTVNSNLSVFSDNDILSVAIDLDNGQMWASKNGNIDTSTTANVTGFATSGYDRDLRIAQRESGNPKTTLGFNFGNPFYSISSGNSDDNGYGNFEYAPPSGYLALCTQNLATELSPTIDDGSEYFNSILYTGTGTTQSITGVGFQPDLVWLKARTQSYYHNWYDSSRGGTLALFSNTNDDEFADTGNLQTFDSDGFTADGFGGTNGSGVNYVAWNWLANGGTTSSNTDGSITSTVQANTTAGFSVVTYTGTGTNATVGHGLGIAPKVIIFKNRSANVNWQVRHGSLSAYQKLPLNETDASSTDFNLGYGSSTTTFSLQNSNLENGNGNSMVAYCFAEIEGYSKFGSYTGNGSTNGTFIYTGFKPSWVLTKTSSDTDYWTIFDTTRKTFNIIDNRLHPNVNDAEYSGDGYGIDMISNGFKQRSTAGAFNGSGRTYIYMAFAENPFATSGAVPVTAR